MEYVTIGRGVHQGYRLPLYYIEHESCLADTRGYGRWSLILIEKGSGIISCGEMQMPFTSPVVLCVNENEHVKLNEASGISLKSVYFDPSVVNSAFSFDNVRHPQAGFSISEEQDLYLLYPFVTRSAEFLRIVTLDAANAQHISKLFRQMNQTLEVQSGFNWPCRSRSYLLEALILVSKLINQEESPVEENDTDICEEVLIYLHTNYPDKITLNELTRIFHVNRTTLNHQFSQLTNLSIIDYLVKYRVQIAATLLRDTLLPISEIMERVGFNNTTHFWRMFKKHTALSPSSYRKQHCWLYASTHQEG